VQDTVKIGRYACGHGHPLLLIAGPCVLETRDTAMRIADVLVTIDEQLPVNVIFKASFDKANRTSIDSVRGPGLQHGLQMLDHVRSQTGLP